MRGCARSCSRRQRRPQHHPEPRALPARAGPAAAAPATVPPKRLPLRGQVNLCDRLLFLPLRLPRPGRSAKPLTQLTLARLRTVSSAQLYRAARAPPRHWTHRPVFLCVLFLSLCQVSSLPIFPPPPARRPPPGAAPSWPGGQRVRRPPDAPAARGGRC